MGGGWVRVWGLVWAGMGEDGCPSPFRPAQAVVAPGRGKKTGSPRLRNVAVAIWSIKKTKNLVFLFFLCIEVVSFFLVFFKFFFKFF